jgi:hypothetical protein
MIQGRPSVSDNPHYVLELLHIPLRDRYDDLNGRPVSLVNVFSRNRVDGYRSAATIGLYGSCRGFCSSFRERMPSFVYAEVKWCSTVFTDMNNWWAISSLVAPSTARAVTLCS